MKRLVASAAMAATFSTSLLAGEPPEIPGLSAPAMSAHDLITMPRLSGPSVTPSGQYAVYSVTMTDAETLARSRQHFIVDLTQESAQSVPIELGLDAYGLRFGPDSFLYFLSYDHPDEDAELRVRVWRAALEGNGSSTGHTPVADIEGVDIAGFKIAPSGDKIAIWAELDRSCSTLPCDEPAPKHLPGPGNGRLYQGDGGFFRHWDRWATPGIYNRVFVFDFDKNGIAGEGIAADGPQGVLVGNTPTMPFGGGDDITWAPDGSGLYFVARQTGAKEPSSTDLDIYYSDLTRPAPIELTASSTAHDSGPAISPDGRYLAYVAMARPGYESDRTVVQLRDLSTGETRALTQDIDRSFGGLLWSLDSKTLYASAISVLDTPAYAIEIESGTVRTLDLVGGSEAHIGNLTALPDGQLLFTRDSIAKPNELYIGSDGQEARRITDVASSRMDGLAPTITTRFSFEGAAGDTVWGQITKLRDQEGPIPAILYIHGGPQGSFRDGWSSRWNPRVVASQGYAVISVDFHGSAGYGQDFMDSINRDWGGKPLEDLQKGLVAALELDTQIDGDRACAMGASYGGYMVNWIAGQWPDRFDCLIQHDGLFDLRSFYYSTEELWFPRWDFGGSYAQSRETYERWNPVNFVDNWRTPMLVVAGERDFRVPYSQGLQSFTALQERNIPSQLLVFPDENHWVLGAENSMQWHNTVFAWLDRWLTKKPTQDSEK